MDRINKKLSFNDMSFAQLGMSSARKSYRSGSQLGSRRSSRRGGDSYRDSDSYRHKNNQSAKMIRTAGFGVYSTSAGNTGREAKAKINSPNSRKSKLRKMNEKTLNNIPKLKY